MKKSFVIRAAAFIFAFILVIGVLDNTTVNSASASTPGDKDNHWNVLALIYKNVKTPTFSKSFSNQEVDELKRMLKDYPAAVKNLSDSRMIIDRMDINIIETPIKSISGGDGDLTTGKGKDIDFDSYLAQKEYQLIVVYAPITDNGPNYSGWLGLGGTYYTYKGRNIFYLIIDMVLDINEYPYHVRGKDYDGDTSCLLHETLHCVETNSSFFNDWDGYTRVHDNADHGYVSEEEYGWLDWYTALMRDDGLGGKGFKPQSFLVTHYDPVADAKKMTQTSKNDITYTGITASTAKGSISGKVIGGGGFWAPGFNEYADAWDSNGDTFYDPAEPGASCWTGIVADQPAVVSEVRVLPRIGFYERTAGASIQGSTDGINWATLASFTEKDCLKEGAAQTYIKKSVSDKKAYRMFRYINDGTNHGDVADVVIIGTSKKAVASGQVIGKVLATDIRAYINGAEIPAYNIDGKLAVVVSDLNNYGFKTQYNNDLRMTTVTRDKMKTSFTSVPSNASGLPIGTPVMNVLSSDIVVELDGKQVEAFNVDNRMAIYFTDLKVYGESVYDNAARASKLTLK